MGRYSSQGQLLALRQRIVVAVVTFWLGRAQECVRAMGNGPAVNHSASVSVPPIPVLTAWQL